jgi:hypothetical protein
VTVLSSDHHSPSRATPRPCFAADRDVQDETRRRAGCLFRSRWSTPSTQFRLSLLCCVHWYDNFSGGSPNQYYELDHFRQCKLESAHGHLQSLNRLSQGLSVRHTEAQTRPHYACQCSRSNLSVTRIMTDNYHAVRLNFKLPIQAKAVFSTNVDISSHSNLTRCHSCIAGRRLIRAAMSLQKCPTFNVRCFRYHIHNCNSL